jgi:hypothetical protein
MHPLISTLIHGRIHELGVYLTIDIQRLITYTIPGHRSH